MRLALSISLIIGLMACSKPEPVQPTNAELTGQWNGTFAIEQAGSCTWGSPASTSATATWQVNNNVVTATLNRTIGQTVVPTTLVGSRTGARVVLTHANKNGNCNGVFRVYSTRYEGDIVGNELTLTGLDTICPVQRCIFKHTIKLTQR